jgi:hypothetical protein
LHGSIKLTKALQPKVNTQQVHYELDSTAVCAPNLEFEIAAPLHISAAPITNNPAIHTQVTSAPYQVTSAPYQVTSAPQTHLPLHTPAHRCYNCFFCRGGLGYILPGITSSQVAGLLPVL